MWCGLGAREARPFRGNPQRTRPRSGSGCSSTKTRNYHRCTMIDMPRTKALPFVILLALSQVVAAQQAQRQPDVIYVPTRQAVVDAMLNIAKVKAGDVVYDLGCGDGRIVVSAAKLGARGVGID